jgi:hypothetical protein
MKKTVKLKSKPFGAKAGGTKDRFTAKKSQSSVIITAVHRKKFGSRLTDTDKEFIRRAEAATGTCAALVGRTRRA